MIEELKRTVNRIVLAVFCVFSAASVCAAAQVSTAAAPFHSGEKLVYRAKWKWLPAGESRIEVLPFERIGDLLAYHFVMTTKTSAAVDLVYKVRDRQDSYTDIHLSRTLLYKKRSTGKHPRDVVVTFDWERMKAVYASFGKPERPVAILPGTFDPLALFFVIRLHELNVGDVLEIPITDGKKCLAVRATVAGRERVAVDAKVYDAHLVIPDMERLENVVAKEKEPQLKIWFSADEKRLPVKIQSRVAIGSFIFELVSSSR
ncbi:MAG: DUF3108 domain-containing protein [Deltaproteobacteria bacterium]|nr:DUF3108 domain-containing protein [Deltaproteobacteria bacterium]